MFLLLASAEFATAVSFNFTNVADNTLDAPSGTFHEFGVPSVSGRNASFQASFIDVATDLSESNGIFVGSGGSLTTIVKSKDAAPTGTFLRDSFNDSVPTISGSTVVFYASYSFGQGVFSGSGGTLTTVAMPGDVTPTGALASLSKAPSISGNDIAFAAGFANDQQGVFVQSEGDLNTIVATGDPAPLGSFGFSPFGDPAISEGAVSFRASYRGGAGIFVANGGPLVTIAKTGDPAPTGTLVRLGDPAISGSKVSFVAMYDGLTKTGIFVSDGNSLTTIVEEGDEAPSGSFSGFGNPSIGGGTVAFQAKFDGQSGIFLGSGGPITPVITTGDSLFGSAVTTLSFGRFGFDPEATGNLAFYYQLANGRRGIAVAKLVPEPNTAALICWCIGALGLRIRMAQIRTARIG
jgi:hypothetical protein